MVAAWTHLGGLLDFGQARETSCFLITGEGRQPWPFTIYPSGRVEVVFQHMTTRPPFDDPTLREEFRQRLDSVAGIDLPAAKLELRPSFPADALADPGARDDVINALSWYLEVSNGRRAAAAEAVLSHGNSLPRALRRSSASR